MFIFYSFGKTKKNGQIEWKSADFTKLDHYLTIIQKLIQASNLHSADTVRTGFSRTTDIAKNYFFNKYTAETNKPLKNALIEGHWRKIVHTDLSIVKELRTQSEKRARIKQGDKYVINYTLIEENAAVDKRLLNKPLTEWDKEDAANAVFFSILNAGPRSIAVLDP